jgi:uncharacterized protein (TIGR03435 family)
VWAPINRTVRRPGASTPNPASEASLPSGELTLFEALDRQLGLKLVMKKQPMPVVVIDHVEKTPTAN